MYSRATNWRAWMTDYIFGSILFIPKGPIRVITDQLRAKYDPFSADLSPAHITITQPFLKAPDENAIERVNEIVRSLTPFDVTIGPALPSPNQKMVWLEVQPREKVLELRDRLHATGLFNLTLPYSVGFIPHLTITECDRPVSEVKSIVEILNRDLRPTRVQLDHLVWSVPSDNFIFERRRIFDLTLIN